MRGSYLLVLGVAVLSLGATAMASPGVTAVTGAVFLEVIDPPPTFILTVAKVGTGSGTVLPSAGSFPVPPTSNIDFSATPDPGSFFGGWNVTVGSGAASSITTYSFSETMPYDNLTALAIFMSTGNTLTTGVSGNGTVDPPAGTHAFTTGLEVKLTATPAGITPFDHWEDGTGTNVGTDNPLTVAVNEDMVRTAVFIKPITGRLVINNNASTTKSTDVSLGLTWGGGSGSGVVRMRFSDDGATWSAWEPLMATKPWALPAGGGYKTVRVQYLDQEGNRSPVFRDYILLDATLPTGSISINGGAGSTSSTAVTLDLTWDDGPGTGANLMRFSNNGANWSAWEPVATPRAYTLPGPAGYNTVRVQFRDRVGNYSTVVSDYIKLLTP